MTTKFVGAIAHRLSDVQFLVLAEYAGGAMEINTRDRFSNTRRGLLRHGLLLANVTRSAKVSAAKRNGARFLRLSAEGRRVLEQAMMMRGGVPLIASPSIEPKERRTDAERQRENAESEAIRPVPADAV